MKFLEGVPWPKRNSRLDFGGDPNHDSAPGFLDPDHGVDPEILKGFLVIFWMGGAWPKEQSVRFWWRSGSRSRSRGLITKKILRLSYDVIITYDNRKSNLR